MLAGAVTGVFILILGRVLKFLIFYPLLINILLLNVGFVNPASLFFSAIKCGFLLPLEEMTLVLVKSSRLSLSSVDIGNESFFLVRGGVLCTVGCLAASLASTH